MVGETAPNPSQADPTHPRIWLNARIATMASSRAGLGEREGLGTIEGGAIATVGGRIIHVGDAADLPVLPDAERIDCEGRWITPGLIDCHTHLVFGGDRSHEFELRLAGASYEEIARAGGGINSTVTATRNASEDELVAASLARLDRLMADGVTTVEVKSGYGLSADAELKQLRAARRLGGLRHADIVTTFLGAHALPREFDDKDRFIDVLIADILPRVAKEKLADAVDAFCEGIAFSPAQCERFFKAAQALGLPVKIHADQLSDLGGAALAARLGALSADHLEYTSDQGAAAMAAAGTVAVILPGAFYFLRETHKPPIEAFRRHGTPMAVATDCNPGTSPLTSLLLAMNMAATLMRMTVDECLLGVTREAARALGRQDHIGTLEVGKQCDLAIWDIERPAELVYRMGFSPLHARVWRGQ
ncbi:imidazolonepropionase [Chelatococcus asaccharovorans]|uniref:imidazolonepropionase n=1 Tax=Chelatococcus asaccharovorans TaxID=28210 RepID=UPI00224C6457|nr:imidazolonepropionase [Chelatococcus asaccharovorans]CAH1674111.1 Imidazolonepropionase [Chelatococcus asaccharovorans]CAH1674514.1 Imidazolonepropionase [Chelatococcus asaccharovorans]